MLVFAVPLAKGTRVGPYEIVGLLGAGGMGEVWRARDPRLGRDVAIKVLPADLARDSQRRARLEREARAASALNHPNIVTVHDLGEADGLVYLVLECVEGLSLRELAAAGPLPLTQLLDVTTQIADGLAKAHAAGIVHRDLKPDNVMVTQEGVVKILDFGLARLEPEAVPEASAPTVSQLTRPGELMGTLSYMSPEQASGQRVDHRSDQFSLGVMCYELATGHSAFARATPRETLAAVLQETPEPIARRRPNLPEQLQRIVGRCLAKDPEERYASTKDLARDLRDLREVSDRSSERAAEAAKPRHRSWVRAAGGGAFVLIAALLVANAGRLRDLVRSATTPRIESVAVLPLANLSRDPEQDFFADGMTEALITDLAKVGSLRVISRTSVMHYKGTTKPLPQIARELGVEAVVEGSVQRAGDRVRISAQLIRATTDHHLWAESYERPLRDILALQSDVSRAIARAVAGTLRPDEPASLVPARPVEPAAYETYLRGVQSHYKGTEADIRTALGLFERAIAADPTFAPAHLRLCDSQYVLGFTGWGAMAPQEAMPRARASCLEALRLDGTMGAAYARLGSILFFYDWDRDAAEAAFERGLRVSPSDPVSLQLYAWFLSARERHAEALSLSLRAEQLDPLSLPASVTHGWLLYWARQYDAAIAQIRRTLEQRPDFPLAHLMLAIVQLQQSASAEVVAELERAVVLAGGTSATVAQLGHIYGVAGRREQAERILSELIARSKREYVASYWIALVHHGLGQEQAALDRLEKAFLDHEALPLLDVEPRWDALRSDARFQNLQRRVGPRASPPP